ncbi:MAG TPA: hypothetical protein PLB63_01550 [Planctomycetota bacterium]|nr:hypothetical protein [Planctomycetota bacterium]HQA99628.1 hypothetical protein [Planctomycetota bacterium]
MLWEANVALEVAILLGGKKCMQICSGKGLGKQSARGWQVARGKQRCNIARGREANLLGGSKFALEREYA